jgi:purine-binding chemotaxis protein CheW
MEQLDALSKKISFGTDGNQYLTFALGDEQYGIEILKVQEIKGYVPPTAVPNTPGCIKGVMNLRGTIIPIVDLRAKLGLPETEYNQFTVIIVTTIGTKVVGLIVDSVSDVLNIPQSDIQAPPEFGATVDVRFIDGIAKAEEKIVMLLNMSKIIADRELDAIQMGE